MIVKICGLKRVEDLILARDLGADLLGMIVGVPESPRSLDLNEAKAMFNVPVGEGVRRALLFRSSPLEDVLRAVNELRPDVVHLCGDEDRLFREKLRREGGNILVWQSVGVPVDDPEDAHWLSRANSLLEEDGVDQVVLDASKAGKAGGVGQSFSLEGVRSGLNKRRHDVILAGGLNVENLKERVEFLRPAGVDVSSGVESQPGQKSPDLLKRFFEKLKEIR